ncbi:MAG: hypothetical protein K8F91_08820, partial [Candidatus Obscuribacterales bacterium]|nr:hypothetical protein [Candidatus Obscuribacterales bacterium]
MHWPTPQQYNEAIQNPRFCFSDAELRRGKAEENSLGLPRSMTGAFASVYKVVSDEAAWAVRCFLARRDEQEERYEAISKFVSFDNLDCTIPFYYLNQGIKVDNSWFPILKMSWVEGSTLGQFVEAHYKESERMSWLRKNFQSMVAEIEAGGIAHGDLQHGNIIITGDGLRLVDYDALFVPELLGKQNLELGHANYQHPLRIACHYDCDVDNFSCWLIDLSLLV